MFRPLSEGSGLLVVAHGLAEPQGHFFISMWLVADCTKTIINPTFFQTTMTIPPRYENRPAHYQLTTAWVSLRPSCTERNINPSDL
jgi:hypothetical protein